MCQRKAQTVCHQAKCCEKDACDRANDDGIRSESISASNPQHLTDGVCVILCTIYIYIDLHRDCVQILFDVKNEAALRVRRINDAVAIYLERFERRADEIVM